MTNRSRLTCRPPQVRYKSGRIQAHWSKPTTIDATKDVFREAALLLKSSLIGPVFPLISPMAKDVIIHEMREDKRANVGYAVGFTA